MDIRNIFFKYRSYTPIPIALTIIYYSKPAFPFNILGILLIAIGEIIRINAVRFAGKSTRTKNVGAPYLCTSGPYSHARNPIYAGNVIIYVGITFFGGGEWMWYLVATVIIFFIFQYHLIISLEEEKLKIKFGKKYKSYINNVPKLIPNVKPWNDGNRIMPRNFLNTFKIEIPTLQSIISMFILILFRP